MFVLVLGLAAWARKKDKTKDVLTSSSLQTTNVYIRALDRGQYMMLCSPNRHKFYETPRLDSL